MTAPYPHLCEDADWFKCVLSHSHWPALNRAQKTAPAVYTLLYEVALWHPDGFGRLLCWKMTPGFADYVQRTQTQYSNQSFRGDLFHSTKDCPLGNPEYNNQSFLRGFAVVP